MNNLINNFAFYTIIGVFIAILIINLIFSCCSLPKLKNKMLKEAPTNKNIKKDLIEELKRIRKKTKMKSVNLGHNNPTKKKEKKHQKV